ncbi:hypothetical protein B0H63DRAFT_483814 [Podospora didyma]|uniref:CorA-like transporter domain-containing protein n=1 Tax=Podospora didyma TaxID=330526 RepID=A0AAE0K9T3_9PEZI|nr:hypothetical protein B0H63DRAFT_483814 [Podospora didyma]
MEFDPHDRLLDACRAASRYPKNILKRMPKNVLQRLHAYMTDNEVDLFDESKARILLWEAWNVMGTKGGNGLDSTIFDNADALAEHLIRDQPDPRYRHIFIESRHSRAPLNCSADMLKLILTFHQVDPLFLDYIFTFGDQDEPLDAGLSHFQRQDALTVPKRLPFIAELGRSGREIRHSFLLRSVERVPTATSWPWSIRQLAAYHSFDVVNGRTVWITVKGNDVMQQRIIDDTSDLPVLRAAFERDVPASFEASLGTHLIYFQWCEENWRWFVRDMEDFIRDILGKAKTVPVDRQPHFRNTPRRAGTGLSSSKKSNTAFQSYPDLLPERRGMFSSFRRRLRRPRQQPQDFELPSTDQRNFAPLQEGLVDSLILDMFNYRDLQKLNIMGERLEEGILVINLNLGVLQDICDYYQRITQSEDIGDVKEQFAKPTSLFLVEIKHIMRSLETRNTQLLSLLKRLHEGKKLFESLLQFRSLEVGRLFAEHGHKSSVVMQNIAYRTEQETVTLRVFTVVTLLFLPATFLSSLFQSGMFDWNNKGFYFRVDVLRVFVAICIPMTVLVLLGWLLTNKWGSLRSRRKSSEDIKSVLEAVQPPVSQV